MRAYWTFGSLSLVFRLDAHGRAKADACISLSESDVTETRQEEEQSPTTMGRRLAQPVERGAQAALPLLPHREANFPVWLYLYCPSPWPMGQRQMYVYPPGLVVWLYLCCRRPHREAEAHLGIGILSATHPGWSSTPLASHILLSIIKKKKTCISHLMIWTERASLLLLV